MTQSKVFKAAVVATLSAGALAATLLARYYPIPCAIAGLWITAFAASMDLHLFTEPVGRAPDAPPAPDPQPWRHPDAEPPQH